MVKQGRKRFAKKTSDICLEKDRPQEKVKIIVPPGLKVKRYPGVSRDEYFSGDNYYFKKQQRTSL